MDPAIVTGFLIYVVDDPAIRPVNVLPLNPRTTRVAEPGSVASFSFEVVAGEVADTLARLFWV